MYIYCAHSVHTQLSPPSCTAPFLTLTLLHCPFTFPFCIHMQPEDFCILCPQIVCRGRGWKESRHCCRLACRRTEDVVAGWSIGRVPEKWRMGRGAELEGWGGRHAWRGCASWRHHGCVGVVHHGNITAALGSHHGAASMWGAAEGHCRKPVYAQGDAGGGSCEV